MTVKLLLDAFRNLKKVSFIKEDNIIEEIDTSEAGSWRAIKKHYDEKVIRVFAIAEDEIRIDSMEVANEGSIKPSNKNRFYTLKLSNGEFKNFTVFADGSVSVRYCQKTKFLGFAYKVV